MITNLRNTSFQIPSLENYTTLKQKFWICGTQHSLSYIFENNDDNTTCSNTFEWCNEGISCEIDNLQNVSYAEDISGWPELFNEQGIFYCSDITKLAPHFRTILEPQGIKSLLQCAFYEKGVFRGYIGFDDCKKIICGPSRRSIYLSL